MILFLNLFAIDPLPKIELGGNRKRDFAEKRMRDNQCYHDPTVSETKRCIGLARSGIVMITCTFDFLSVSLCRRVVEYDSDGCCCSENISEMFDDALEHFIEELGSLASDAGHVVEYVSEVIAESSGLYPFGNGSSPSDSEQCSKNERDEERFDLRFEFAIKALTDVWNSSRASCCPC